MWMMPAWVKPDVTSRYQSGPCTTYVVPSPTPIANGTSRRAGPNRPSWAWPIPPPSPMLDGVRTAQ